jgi:proteasome beta subunit
MFGFSGTVVGVVCDDGVALASDTRGAAYYTVLSKRVRKIFQLDDKIGAAIAGSSGDIQRFVDVIKAEANIYKLEHGYSISTKALAQLAANTLHQRRLFPYIMEAIFSGVDDDGPHLYFLDPIGGKLEENKFASAGTGSTIAYGTLEQSYRGGMVLKDGARLAVQSIKTAIERDAATGEKVMLALIDKKGYRELSEKEVEDLLSK